MKKRMVVDLTLKDNKVANQKCCFVKEDFPAFIFFTWNTTTIRHSLQRNMSLPELLESYEKAIHNLGIDQMSSTTGEIEPN